jgi:hypothetical protein
MKFRKRPVVIEAIHYDGTDESLADVRVFAGAAADTFHTVSDARLEIMTLEGTLLASPGDWIIRGVAGEIYPCKPDIFAATYDPVEAA